MARPSSKHPTELELTILKILWRVGPSPVKTVQELLGTSRELTYSSVTTIMNIMVRKKYLSREKSGPRYVYAPRVEETTTTARMLKDIVDRAFDGSAAAVVHTLLDASELNDAEIKELRAYLDRQKEGDKR
jgi:BlaI family transcriptional regulator, penicillinase repressor